jgi:FkbM family methyltransferase
MSRKSIPEYVVEPIMSTKDVKGLEGQFLDEDHYHTLIDNDADVYWDDNGVKKLLFHFRKNVIPSKVLKGAVDALKKSALKASSIRGTAGGPADPKKISPNVKAVASPGRFRTKIIFEDGKVSNYYASNKVNSLIAGYFDKERIVDRKAVLKGEMIPCRTTQFTMENTEKWERVLPLMEFSDQLYEKLEPETHSKQHQLASLTPEYQITDTAFSTLTVNYNWRTACHVDAGDYTHGNSVLIVAGEGDWAGGCLGYPRFGVMVDVRNGDFLLKDPHQHHCNTKITPVTKDYTRLSFVIYYRENMQKCAKQPPQPQTQKGGAVSEMTLVPAKFPKKKIDLEVYIRPETTDIKVIDEVLKTTVYEKPKLGFRVEPGDHWLDLGGNIGTFALFALARGATVVTCEPEADNLKMLEKNLLHNFPDKAGIDWHISPVAVTTDPNDQVDLYLCKGDYNKYRHTVHKKRGRSTVAVKNMHIRDALKKGKFNAIKIDIEGAEIAILEELKEKDYTGIDKLVYEYSFDVDPSIPRFMAIIHRLRTIFSVVHYTKVKEDELEYKHFPAAAMVFCRK